VALPGLTAFTQANVDTTTYAIFGDFNYKFTEQLSLSVGGRYTWDNRRAAILRQNYLGGGSPVFGGLGIAAGAPSTNFRGERDFNKFTPRASLSFQPNRDHNIYASYSQGFKGGGFDPRGVGVNAPAATPGRPTDAEISSYLSFRPETVDSYELGYKGNMLNGALYVAIAAFRMDYKDVQIPGSAGCTVAGVPTFCGIITNAGRARFQGVEVEANARLGRNLLAGGDRINLSGSLGFIDAKYKEYITFIAGRGSVDVAKYRYVQNTPKVTASGTLAYSAPIGSGDLNLSTTASYRSTTHQFEIANPYIDQRGYTLIDANLVYTAEGGRWSLGLHGKNLTNKLYKTSGYTFIAANAETGAITQPLTPTLGTEGTLTAFYGNPRQVFVTGTLAF
jgi:iron complex outermembrane receptor protein